MSMSLKRFLSYVLVLAMVISLLPGAFLADTVKAADTHTVICNEDWSPVKSQDLYNSIMEGYNLLKAEGHIAYDLDYNIKKGTGMRRPPSDPAMLYMNCTDFVAWMYGYYLPEIKGYRQCPIYQDSNTEAGTTYIFGQDSVVKIARYWLGDGVNPGTVLKNGNNSMDGSTKMYPADGNDHYYNFATTSTVKSDKHCMSAEEIAEIANPGDIITFNKPYDSEGHLKDVIGKG